MSHAIAAFPKTWAQLAEVVRSLRLNAEAMSRPLRRCDLARCGGTCCHDGVYLSAEESGVVREVAERARPSFVRMGLDLPANPVVYGKWRGYGGPKTATRPAPEREAIPGYPAHFPRTSCVFLLPDARCGLQCLSEEEGLSPWYYKPLTCWLHPLAIVDRPDGSSWLTLHDEHTDPQTFSDYDGFVSRTHCGQTCEGGEPAWRVLEEEIGMLGRLGDRDLAAEIAAALR